MRKSTKIIMSALIVAICAAWFGITLHRKHVQCAIQNAAFRQQVEKLERDASNTLRIGVSKDGVARFFQEHKMAVTFQRDEASGSLQTFGCAPFGCGADAATIGVSIAVDDQGTVTGRPHVSGIYTDCL